MTTFEPATQQDAVLTISGSARPNASLSRAREVIRCGGFSMDAVTGAVHWRGRRVTLALEERELLGVLLRRAGQILSVERLAALLGSRVDAVDRRVAALICALEDEGIRTRPRRAEGLGYILWR